MLRPEPSHSVFDWLTPRRLVLVVSIGLVSAILFSLRATLTPVLVAAFFAYALHPLVDRLLAWRRWPLGRSLTVLLLLVLIGIAVTLFLLYLIPALTVEVNNLRVRLPRYFFTLRQFNAETLAPWLNQHLGVTTPTTFAQLELFFQEQLESGVAQLAGTLNSGLRSALVGTVGLLKLLFNIILVPFFFFFILRDAPQLVDFAAQLVPPRYQHGVQAFLGKLDSTLAHFLRGQLTVSATLALCYTLALAIAGVDLAIFLGVLSGLLFLIPYVGIAVACGLTLSLSLLNFSSWWQILAIVLIYSFMPMFEMFVLTPKIVGSRLRLSPALVIFALLSFGALLGVLGVIIALPTTALLKVIGTELIHRYLGSSFYQGQSSLREAELDPGSLID